MTLRESHSNDEPEQTLTVTCFVELCQQSRLSGSPYCPTHGPDSSSTRTHWTPPPRQQWAPQAFLIGFVAILSLMIAVGGMDGSASASGHKNAASFEESSRESMVRATCRRFVGERLQAPASAAYDSEVVTGQEPTYVVVGNVSVDGSLGPSLSRSAAFRCTLRQDGDDDWRLVSLNGV